MISPAQQQLDEALTTAGHNDNCPAFEGRRCPGYPACSGNPVDDALYAAVGADLAAEQAKRPRLVTDVRERAATDGSEISGVVCDRCGKPCEHGLEAWAARHLGCSPSLRDVPPDAVVFTGARAAAFKRYEAAARDLKTADAMHKAAQREYQEAHAAFADAVAGA